MTAPETALRSSLRGPLLLPDDPGYDDSSYEAPTDPVLRVIESTISNERSTAFLVQTCEDADRERRLERQLNYIDELDSDYTKLTGREAPALILIVEGDACEWPDHFEESMRIRWRELREARRLLDELKASS